MALDTGQSTSVPASGYMGAIGLENRRNASSMVTSGPPVEIGAGIGDLRYPLLHILITLTVIVVRGGFDQLHSGPPGPDIPVFRRQFQHPDRQFAH